MVAASLTFYSFGQVRRVQVVNDGRSEPVTEGFVALAYARDVRATHSTDNGDAEGRRKDREIGPGRTLARSSLPARADRQHESQQSRRHQ